MSLPTHHPGDALLMDYAGGGLGEAGGLVVATHLALCPGCRHAVNELEAVGGALLDGLEPDTLSPGALDALLTRLDEPDEPAPPHRMPPPPGALVLPEPLRSYVGCDLSQVRWRMMAPGFQCSDIRLSRGERARLVRMKGGASVPQHSHDGLELAIVLHGGFSDSLGHFVRGDVAVGDGSIDHKPVADPEGCVCLSVTLGRLRLTGAIGRFLNPFLRL
ncbi:ChrR family anti-sigma-E factor [Azospirillum sp. sgz301742]